MLPDCWIFRATDRSKILSKYRNGSGIDGSSLMMSDERSRRKSPLTLTPEWLA